MTAGWSRMVFHLGYDYTLEHGLVCDGDRVDRSRMYLQLSRGIKGTLSTKKLGKEYARFFELRCRSLLFTASHGNMIPVVRVIFTCLADPGTSKSKGKEALLGLRAEGVGHGAASGNWGRHMSRDKRMVHCHYGDDGDWGSDELLLQFIRGGRRHSPRLPSLPSQI
ncbi:hypothetical protein Sjap_023055 [Stephania japonica]|uniref:Uncharacterized protein n=1 Tax=Stephania japonica TaxID=461633 RepID=A0AAP0HQG1_9MAGN